ncbi:hypothetical protein [Parasporobacterium paucivorans]|uniref:hypothetical protein n=1 Tax=Parasporobacterium paucivorans TaxID=115544 RepID=UPI0015BB6629|nr:hypothetical protein [Parasporobacterium paucivorans]
MENISTVLSEDDDQTTEKIESKLNELQQGLLRLLGVKSEYQTQFYTPIVFD